LGHVLGVRGDRGDQSAADQHGDAREGGGRHGVRVADQHGDDVVVPGEHLGQLVRPGELDRVHQVDVQVDGWVVQHDERRPCGGERLVQKS
jgi:hypothetical protein